jgi:hypothetical protein
LAATDTASLSSRINTKLGTDLIDTTGKALGSILKWNGAKWVDSTDNTGAGGTLTLSDTTGAIATDYDVSLKLNAAAIDTGTVLYWPDTLSRIATNYDLPVYRLDTVTATLDSLLVTVASVTRVMASVSGSSTGPPIPVRAYVKSGTEYVLKFDYDLTVNQPVEVSYWR